MGGALKMVTRVAKTLIEGPEMPKTPDTPTLQAVDKEDPKTVMPSPDDEAVKKAKRRAVATAAKRSGRSSTILSRTVENEPLGG